MIEDNGVAIVRKELALLRRVSRTWFEWEMQAEGFTRVLVVEVDCDTDPNSTACDRWGIEAIGEAVRSILTEQTTMVISQLRIVPKDPPQYVPPRVPVP